MHIAKVTVDALQKKYPHAKNIAVIATSGTKKAGVYDQILKERGLKSVDFSKETQDVIMECIYKGVKAGKLEEYVPVFYEVLSNIEADVLYRRLHRDTDVFTIISSEYKFIDATFELAKAGVEFGLEKRVF